MSFPGSYEPGYEPHEVAEPGPVPELHDPSAWEPNLTPYATPGEGLLPSTLVPAEIGSPAEYEHYWFYQEHNGYCVPASLTQVIEAQTGLPIHGYSLVEKEASRLGIPATGLNFEQAQDILRTFDIPSHVEYAGSTGAAAIDTLAGYLEHGTNIIVGVNANPIWYGTQDSPQDPHGEPDHALVVSSINPGTGTVTLSDPGIPSGNEEVVPLEVFQDAWSASGYQMLVTDDAPGGADHSAAVSAVEDIAHPLPSVIDHVPSATEDALHRYEYILLPIALAAGWTRTRNKPAR
jgi:hypothetical protein